MEAMPVGHRLGLVRKGITFLQCLQEAIETPEIVANFDRLYGATLTSRSSPIERMVDIATGKRDYDMRAFVEFVWDGIFLRF